MQLNEIRRARVSLAQSLDRCQAFASIVCEKISSQNNNDRKSNVKCVFALNPICAHVRHSHLNPICLSAENLLDVNFVRPIYE